MSETIFNDISLSSLIFNDNNNEYLVGEIIMWPHLINIPSTFLECNGQSLNRTTYSDLFNIIGTKYGSVDINHFNLPNLNNSGLNTSNQQIIRGITNMNESSNVSSFTFYDNTNYGNNLISINQIPTHNHNINSRQNITYNISSNSTVNSVENSSVQETRANASGEAVNTENTKQGGKSNVTPAAHNDHVHIITYEAATYNSKTTNISQGSINNEYNSEINNNINSQRHYNPSHIKVNYLICHNI